MWLIPGLVLKGFAQLGIGVPVTGTLHAITIGAIGTTTLVMMARTAMLRARIPIDDFQDIGSAAVLLSVAALSRLLGAFASPTAEILIYLAAGCWSAAFLILLIRLVRIARFDHTRRIDQE